MTHRPPKPPSPKNNHTEEAMIRTPNAGYPVLGVFYEKISVPNTASKKNAQKRQQV